MNFDFEEFPAGLIADWRVTVIRTGETPPVCQTIPGREINQGWSIYDWFERRDQDFEMDEWVGETGCEGRLTEGQYIMFVTWTPRGPFEPVTAQTRFSVE